METRNILDSQGNIIGSLSFPEGTSEDIWTAALAQYTIESTEIDPILKLHSTTVSMTSTTTTSSTTASTIEGMSLYPEKGRYLVNFSGSIYTSGASATGEFAIYKDSTIIQSSRREISCNLQLLGGLVTISLNAIGVGTFTSYEIELNGEEELSVKFRSTNGGTIGFKERVLSIIKVS